MLPDSIRDAILAAGPEDGSGIGKDSHCDAGQTAATGATDEQDASVGGGYDTYSHVQRAKQRPDS